jgi:hypothetical protein
LPRPVSAARAESPQKKITFFTPAALLGFYRATRIGGYRTRQ